MAHFSAIFLVLTLALAVVIGPQTRAWSWGPALFTLGIAVCAAIPTLWRKERKSWDFGLAAFGILVAAWFAWRASTSAVSELAEADLMLLAGVVGTFVCIRGIEGNRTAGSILGWGIALILLANILVIGRQVFDPTFTPIFGSRAAGFPSGFYAHYNEAANYLIASSLLVAADSLFRRHSTAVRILLMLISLGGFAAIYFTRSRGGILGGAVGLGIFVIAALMVGKRIKAKWFGPAMVTLPLVGLLAGGFLYMGWKDSQALRLSKVGGVRGSGIAQMMDNDGRLYLLGMAMSCVQQHPLSGGGSRSFSWESFKHSEGKQQGNIITHVPEMVHNELLQAATDYGLIGAGLLAAMLMALVLAAIIRTLFDESDRTADPSDAWCVGGLSALGGMFVQSCFSFVFHLLPGAILLGICLGQISRASSTPGKPAQILGTRILLSLAAIFCVIFLFPTGWKGARLTGILWPSYFSKQPVTEVETRIEALDQAIGLWPQSSLYQDRAFLFQESSSRREGLDATLAAERAIADYQQAEQLHPFDPNPVVNRANVLSQLHRDKEAEDAYDRAISLQGGMESAFRARFYLTRHLMRKAQLQSNREYPADSLATLEIAAQQMERAVKEMDWGLADMNEWRIAVQESLGAAYEANGNYKDAMAAYDLAVTFIRGSRAHYRAGLLNGKLASIAWNARRPAEAMGYFIEAKRRIGLARDLPQDVTPSQRLENVASLDQAINYLKGAKIEPVPPKK